MFLVTLGTFLLLLKLDFGICGSSCWLFFVFVSGVLVYAGFIVVRLGLCRFDWLAGFVVRIGFVPV